MNLINFAVASVFALLGACSSGDEKLIKQPAKEPLLNGQMRALEKAKGVEKLLQDNVDRQKLLIDEETR